MADTISVGGAAVTPAVANRDFDRDEPAFWNPGRVDAAIVIGIVAGLMTIGLLMTFSASIGLVRVDRDGDVWQSAPIRKWLRQLVFVAAGFGLMVVWARIPYRIWRWRPRSKLQPSVAFFLLALVLVLMVFVPGVGREINSSRRWIQLVPGVDATLFQPSELAKLALIILLAAWFSSDREGAVPNAAQVVRGVFVACLVIGAAAGPVIKEDLGTGALLAAIGGMMFLAAGARWWHLLLLSLPAAFGLWHQIASKPYRVERLTMFTKYWDHALGKGYHQVQSLCAIASGGWIGRGLGQGIQKYGYLPESTTDSIFAIVCEELGMPGALLIIGMFLALLWQGGRIMQRCPDRFGKLLALGITLMLVFQAAINIAVATVSVPTKGIALPFVSAGGSGMLCLSIMAGILANIARHRPVPAPAAPPLP